MKNIDRERIVRTFPENSGDSGLVDPGPFFGVWMTLMLIQIARHHTWIAPASPTPDTAA